MVVRGLVKPVVRGKVLSLVWSLSNNTRLHTIPRTRLDTIPSAIPRTTYLLGWPIAAAWKAPKKS